jgi:hypothetical protein
MDIVNLNLKKLYVFLVIISETYNDVRLLDNKVFSSFKNIFVPPNIINKCKNYDIIDELENFRNKNGISDELLDGIVKILNKFEKEEENKDKDNILSFKEFLLYIIKNKDKILYKNPYTNFVSKFTSIELTTIKNIKYYNNKKVENKNIVEYLSDFIQYLDGENSNESKVENIKFIKHLLNAYCYIEYNNNTDYKKKNNFTNKDFRKSTSISIPSLIVYG